MPVVRDTGPDTEIGKQSSLITVRERANVGVLEGVLNAEIPCE